MGITIKRAMMEKRMISRIGCSVGAGSGWGVADVWSDRSGTWKGSLLYGSDIRHRSIVSIIIRDLIRKNKFLVRVCLCFGYLIVRISRLRYYGMVCGT